MDRRSFLKNAGFAAVGASAVAMGLAGCSPSDADSKPAAGQAPAWDEEFDVVVVGAGASGEMAALEAANAGLSVVVLEALDSPMGNASYVTGANMFVAGTDEEGMEATVDDLYDYYIGCGAGGADEAICRMVADNVPGMYQRLLDLGVEFNAVVQPGMFGTSPVKHTPVGEGGALTSAIAAAAETAGRKLCTGTRARKLVVDEAGRVVGVKAEAKGGEKLYGASKGVILACGTFLRNEKLLRTLGAQGSEFLADNTMAGAADMGDGLVMAMEIGADTHLLGVNVFPHGYTAVKTAPNHPCYYMAWFNAVPKGGVLVNMLGKRFASEDVYHPALDAAMLVQPSRGMAFAIFDDAVHQANGALDNGYQFTGATYEELASAIAGTYPEFDKEGFARYMASYNDGIASGVDAEFGRKVSPVPLVTGPFYAIAVQPEVNVTMGGLRTDTSSRVISYYTDEPIPGLYAAGVVAGGMGGFARSIPGGTNVIKGLIQGVAAVEDMIAE